MTNNACYVCKGVATGDRISGFVDVSIVRCENCGEYCATGVAENLISKLEDIERASLSSYLFGRKFHAKTLPLLLESDPKPREEPLPQIYMPIWYKRIIDENPLPSVGERLDRTLLNLKEMSNQPGAEVLIKKDTIAVAYAENVQSKEFIFRQLHADGMLESMDQVGVHTSAYVTRLILSVKAWNRVAEIERGHLGPSNKQVFVAMSFDKGLLPIYENGIKPGIEDSGYKAFRVDKQQSNNQITDEIVAGINRSKFLVADFTGHRPGVYYEAGLMRGLGRPVIFCCQKDGMKDAHFDTRQFPHIIWQKSEDLREQLKNRILATIII